MDKMMTRSFPAHCRLCTCTRPAFCSCYNMQRAPPTQHTTYEPWCDTPQPRWQIVYMDADQLVLQPIAELFDYPDRPPPARSAVPMCTETARAPSVLCPQPHRPHCTTAPVLHDVSWRAGRRGAAPAALTRDCMSSVQRPTAVSPASDLPPHAPASPPNTHTTTHAHTHTPPLPPAQRPAPDRAALIALMQCRSRLSRLWPRPRRCNAFVTRGGWVGCDCRRRVAQPDGWQCACVRACSCECVCVWGAGGRGQGGG